MSQRVNTPARLEAARSKIAELLGSQAEWFCTLSDAHKQAAKTEALGRSELDVAIAQGRLILTCWTEKGSRTWKVYSWEWTGEKLLLQASRRFNSQSRAPVSL